MTWAFICLILFVSCSPKLPKTKFSPFSVDLDYKIENDSLKISIGNVLKCPLRISANTEDSIVKNVIEDDFPLTLQALMDTSWVKALNTNWDTSKTFKISFSATYGDKNSLINPCELALPFPRNKSYKIVQGYNGSFSHQSDFSRYAIDFNLSIGDTIVAAADGIVVGLIQDYKHNGGDRSWRPYANYITLYHDSCGFFTQYVHLDYQGSLVEIGDTVKVNQAIAISGLTGWTTSEHLHFNCLKANDDGLISFPVKFRELESIEEIKQNRTVRKK